MYVYAQQLYIQYVLYEESICTCTLSSRTYSMCYMRSQYVRVHSAAVHTVCVICKSMRKCSFSAVQMIVLLVLLQMNSPALCFIYH